MNFLRKLIGRRSNRTSSCDQTPKQSKLTAQDATAMVFEAYQNVIRASLVFDEMLTFQREGIRIKTIDGSAKAKLKETTDRLFSAGEDGVPLIEKTLKPLFDDLVLQELNLDSHDADNLRQAALKLIENGITKSAAAEIRIARETLVKQLREFLETPKAASVLTACKEYEGALGAVNLLRRRVGIYCIAADLHKRRTIEIEKAVALLLTIVTENEGYTKPPLLY